MSTGLRWLLSGLVIMAIVASVGFAAYDFRDKLRPYQHKLANSMYAACEALPTLGLDGRYQDIRGCPWDFRLGPKQTFSGILYFYCEDSADFQLHDTSMKAAHQEDDVFHQFHESVKIEQDELASHTLHQITPQPINPCGGPPFAIEVVGWRLHYKHTGEWTDDRDVILIDHFIRAAPFENETASTP